MWNTSPLPLLVNEFAMDAWKLLQLLRPWGVCITATGPFGRILQWGGRNAWMRSSFRYWPAI